MFLPYRSYPRAAASLIVVPGQDTIVPSRHLNYWASHIEAVVTAGTNFLRIPEMTSSSSSNTSILRVQDLQTYFPIRQGLLGTTVGFVRAVDGVSFVLNAGETLSLIHI